MKLQVLYRKWQVTSSGPAERQGARNLKEAEDF